MDSKRKVYIDFVKVIFMFMVLFNHRFSGRVCITISIVGGTTFGIYLIENILRSMTDSVFVTAVSFFRRFYPVMFG